MWVVEIDEYRLDLLFKFVEKYLWKIKGYKIWFNINDIEAYIEAGKMPINTGMMEQIETRIKE